MPISNANATWDGDLKSGRGTMKPAHGPEAPFSLRTRFEGEAGTNPDEMLGAALAGCFSMALAGALERAGTTPESIRTSAKVHVEKGSEGFGIPLIELSTEVRAPGADAAKIRAVADETKTRCPVGKALAGTQVTVDAKLV